MIYLYNFQMADSLVLRMLKEGELKDEGIVKHIANLIRTQVSDTSELKGLDNIEQLSYFVRKHQFHFQHLLKDFQLHQNISATKYYPPYLDNFHHLCGKVQTIQHKPIIMPDIFAEYQALKKAGVSVGEKNCYYLNQVLKELSANGDVKEIKFWGKILGKKDYWVIQGITTRKYISQIGPDAEAYGTGVNDYSYWVSNNVLGQWNELPLVSPGQVRASREFKYVFSGELEAAVDGLVKFEGRQKHLLKCVISRITHSCEIVPKGIYKINEQNGSVEFEDQMKVPEVAELGVADNWVHFPSNILQQGRTTHYIDPSLEGEDRDNRVNELNEKDPIVERLKTISEDKPYEWMGFTAAANWTVDKFGQNIPVNLTGKQEGQTAVYGVVALKNLSWPGAMTVAYRGGWVNIYVGYGHRANQQNKIMKHLAELEQEGQDQEEKSEPNPSKPPAEKVENAAQNEQPADGQ